MEILKNFGFDPVILTAQIVNFLIILYLLKRFMYKPVLEMLRKRKESIAEGIKQTEQARETLEKAMLEEKKILEKAKLEAVAIIDNAKTASLEVSKEIEENAKTQAENIMLEAKTQIDQESKEVERKLIDKVTRLAEDILRKSLEGIFSEKEQKEIAQRALKKFKKID